MAEDRPPADRLPTLTEVVELQPAAENCAGAGASVTDAGAAPRDEAPVLLLAGPPEAAVEAGQDVTRPDAEPAGPGGAPEIPAVDLDGLVTRVLQEISPRIDMLVQARLREALAPALARAAEQFIRDARDPVALVLNDLVRDAVLRALQRHDDET